MKSDFQIRFTAGLLILLTTAAVVLAFINFQKEPEFQTPTDGVVWLEQGDRLVAQRLESGGPGARGGIQVGDQLVAINHHDVKTAVARSKQLFRAGIWSKATYSLVHQSVPVDMVLILTPEDRSLFQWERLIALIYLGIGLYVLLRRWTAPSSTHFYVFCLVSFIYYSFHFTGKLNAFDWTVFWGNIVAGLLQAALFLHFVLVFPEKRPLVKKHSWVVPAIYVPGAFLLSLRLLAFKFAQANERLKWNLDRLDMLV
jgi:hypothetical protein